MRQKRRAVSLAPGQRIPSKRVFTEPTSSMLAEGTVLVVGADLPRNPNNNRFQASSVSLNSIFPKNYAAAVLAKEPPDEITVGQAYHVVSKQIISGRPNGGVGTVDNTTQYYPILPILLNTTQYCH